MKVKSLMVVLAALVGLSAFAAPEIQCVADGSSGEYCGEGYGITVNVSTPSSGYTIKYSESGDGDWVDELTYVNVCMKKPIYYQVTAPGYDTKVGSAEVTIMPKTLTNDYIWLVLPPEDYVYDGEPKEPEVAASDGDPSIITDDDWEVSFENNTDAGTATATFTGKGNYTGSCTEDFEIEKADNEWTTEPSLANWTYGQTPSSPVSAAKSGTATVTYSSGSVPTLPGDYTATFTVAESQNYNELTKTVDFKVIPATIGYVADGSSGEYCGEGYGITVNVSTPSSGYTVKYSESGDGDWVDELKYVNVCTDKPIHFQITATGYATVTGSKTVTITPKTLTNDYIWLVLPPEDYVYDGEAKEPDVAAADGDPSIITDDDWEVSFENNTDAGTATATFTGKGNYTGSCTEDFEIKKADNEWTTPPSLANWTYGQTPSSPVSAAKSGTAAVTYSSGSVPTLPGDYTATFTVAESQNYNELTKTVDFKVIPATIGYVADGSSGEYCGEGYGITVNVSTPSSGYTIKYSESGDGDWVDELKYVNVCTDKPIYFQITATGYATVTGSKNVTITPKELTNDYIWLVLPPEDYVYDGEAKEPDVAAADGDPSIITDDDWEVSFENNTDAGTATATFTGKGNYFGECYEDFEILKADITDGGGEPGSGVVPAGGKSKFDATYEYDGQPHTIKTDELTAAFVAQFTGKGVAAPSGFKYSTDWNGSEGTWADTAPTFVNVVVTSFFYKVCSADPNYDDYIHEAKLTITPRDITKATVADIPDQQHTGAAIKPPVIVTDGNPTIITSDDYTVAYSDNIAIGQATVTLTGKCNYTGTKTVHFMIKGSSTADLKAEIAWKLLKASGTYMAQLKVTCTSGLATGISNLRFMFADRVSGGTTFASLWATPSRAAKSTTMTYNDETYRYVALDATKITAENVAVTFGVSNLAATAIPTAERTIELYVRKRVNPTTGKEEAAGVDNFVGYVSWVSSGETTYLPVVAGAQAVPLSKAALGSPAPMKIAAVNTALAVGSIIAEGSCPYCKLTEFAVSDSEITGVVEVGSVSSEETEHPGKLGPNATVTLLGTDDLGLDFKEICSVATDSVGRFRLAKPDDCRFFKLKLSVDEVVE